MTQLALNFTHRARKSDPLTSHVSARRASSRMYEVIVNTLTVIGEGTSWEIAAYAHIDPIDVARRMKKLEEAGHVVRTDKVRNNDKGNPCTVWSV